MQKRNLTLLAAAGSLALLGGALYFQYYEGLAPCKLCLWQRWPHRVAIAIGLLILLVPDRRLALAGGLVVLAGSAIGLYHAGIELHWWQGPTTCTSGSIEGLSTGELLDKILAAPVVRCDEVAWSLLGISMAGWNALISLGLALAWFASARRA